MEVCRETLLYAILIVEVESRKSKNGARMVRVFIPEKKGKIKTNVRGFWYSKDTKRTYYDYLNVITTPVLTADILENLKRRHNQECIAYIAYGIMDIYYNRDKIEVLRKRIYSEVKNLKQEIKEALKQYGGVTIYKSGKKYFKEIYFNE